MAEVLCVYVFNYGLWFSFDYYRFLLFTDSFGMGGFLVNSSFKASFYRIAVACYNFFTALYRLGLIDFRFLASIAGCSLEGGGVFFSIKGSDCICLLLDILALQGL